MTRYVVLALTRTPSDGHLYRWHVWLSYIRGIGEVVGSDIEREPEDWHWRTEPVRSAA